MFGATDRLHSVKGSVEVPTTPPFINEEVVSFNFAIASLFKISNRLNFFFFMTFQVLRFNINLERILGGLLNV
ncbi:hypothetical protein GCM10022258_28900 [Aquimarina gracilis]